MANKFLNDLQLAMSQPRQIAGLQYRAVFEEFLHRAQNIGLDAEVRENSPVTYIRNYHFLRSV